MTREANTFALLSSTDRTVVGVTERSSVFSGLFSGPKVAEQLAAIAGCDVRSAQRYLAGERTPPGDVVFAMLLDPVIGPRVLARITARAERELSPADFQKFQLQMAAAVVRADIRETNEASR